MHAAKMKYKSGNPPWLGLGLKIEDYLDGPPPMVVAGEIILYDLSVLLKWFPTTTWAVLAIFTGHAYRTSTFSLSCSAKLETLLSHGQELRLWLPGADAITNCFKAPTTISLKMMEWHAN